MFDMQHETPSTLVLEIENGGDSSIVTSSYLRNSRIKLNVAVLRTDCKDEISFKCVVDKN